jgi:glycosyltransferase involved in cell wall biosynthesis
MKVLIISRSYFPLISPRAFRTTELAEELAKKGHDVFVYAVLGKYDYLEYEKKTGVHVCSLGKTVFATSDSDGNYRYTFIDKILFHVLNKAIEFPDIELMFKTLSVIRKENDVDILITIAFPYPIHWGAALARCILKKNNFATTWISDCGDPYFGNSIQKKGFYYFKYIERWWGKKTDYITIPTEDARDGYLKECMEKIRIIPQGFNFDKIRVSESYEKNNITTFAYAGSIYRGKRDPVKFIEYLADIDQDFRFIIYTNDIEYLRKYEKLLGDRLILSSYIKREDLIYELSKMDFLINLKNPTSIQSPSKIIDYLFAKRPIMNVGVDFQEKDVLNEFLKGNYKNQMICPDVQEYDIKVVAEKFLSLYGEKKKKN